MKLKQILIITCMLLFISCKYGVDGCNTAYKEYKPSTLLSKYEWFKNEAAGIDKKRADIEMYQEEISSLGKPVDKDDKFYLEQRKSELIGIIAMHNQMCAEYNASMSKFNYAFCNTGSLPEGATVPLPREFKPYITHLKQR